MYLQNIHDIYCMQRIYIIYIVYAENILNTEYSPGIVLAFVVIKRYKTVICAAQYS